MAARSTSSARSTASRRKKAKPLYGCETPRIFTPPLRPLTPKTSLGFACIEFCEEVIGIELFPWQRWLLIHMLETLPDGSLRFRTVVVLVARQNGKSTLSIVLSLFFMYVLAKALVIGTAQDLDVAEEIWQGAVDIVEETGELDELKARVVKVNGKKSLELKTGERYKVKAANRRAGRGLSGDLVLLDELREHQTWDAWGAITKTTMARAFALIVALSNAGDASSVVLRYLRKMAHLAIGDPDGINADDDPALLLPDEAEPEDYELEDDDTLGIFEWSAPPGCGLHDRKGWAQANPSLGYSIAERTIASAARTDPEWIFRTEVLCQWSDGSLEGPFPPGAWEKTCDDKSRVAEGNPISLGIDMSWDRTITHIGIAGLRKDGLPHVGILASRAGTDWVADWLDSDAAPPFAHIVIQANGAPASSLIEGLRADGFEVLDWSGSDLGKATGQFYDHVRAAVGEGESQTELRHRTQPLLDVAAATAATKPAGDAWLWDRKKSPADAAPLIAVTGALWGLSQIPEPVRSAYEDHDLVVI